MRSGEGAAAEDETRKPVKPEVYCNLDMAAAAGLMPRSTSSAGLPLWCDQKLVNAVAGSQVQCSCH